jgi:glycine/D-amino acid oxidase-like deaminating enzyme
MAATFDVAIAGAGIVDAACAAKCAAAGLGVVVVEPGPAGCGPQEIIASVVCSRIQSCQ